MDILCPLPKTKSGSKHLVVLTEQYTNLIRAIPVFTVIGTSTATVYFNNWVIPYGIPTYQLIDSGLRFVSKLFAAVTAHLGIKYVTTTVYHPQTPGQVEIFNKKS